MASWGSPNGSAWWTDASDASAAGGAAASHDQPSPYHERGAWTAAAAVYGVALVCHVHRLRSSRPDPIKAWRATGWGTSRDGPARRAVKTLVTSLLLSVLPMQVAVVGASIVLQIGLYLLGFGGGRPGVPSLPAVPVDSPAWNPLGRLLFRARDRAAYLAAPLLLKDVRNAPYLPWMAHLAIVTPSLFAAFAWHHMAVGRHRSAWYQLGACFLYRVLMMGPYFKFFAHGATLIHKEGHANRARRGLFRGPLAPALNRCMERWVGLFYGHVPENYRIGHVEVHHGEGNGHGDVTSTLGVDRAKDGSFLMYLGDFAEFWSNLAVVEWLDARIDAAAASSPPSASSGGDSAVARLRADRTAALAGSAAYYGAAAALCASLGPWFAFGYYIEPHLEVINYLAAINYTWHAFADPDDHDNEYVKSITILRGHYLVFGEDYHVEHHLRPGVHWTMMAAEYEKRRGTYAENRATVFADTMEFELFVMILLGDHDALAERFVDPSGSFPTHEDKKRELLRRMKPVPAPKPEPSGNARGGKSTNAQAGE